MLWRVHVISRVAYVILTYQILCKNYLSKIVVFLFKMAEFFYKLKKYLSGKIDEIIRWKHVFNDNWAALSHPVRVATCSCKFVRLYAIQFDFIATRNDLFAPRIKQLILNTIPWKSMRRWFLRWIDDANANPEKKNKRCLYNVSFHSLFNSVCSDFCTVSSCIHCIKKVNTNSFNPNSLICMNKWDFFVLKTNNQPRNWFF